MTMAVRGGNFVPGLGRRAGGGEGMERRRFWARLSNAETRDSQKTNEEISGGKNHSLLSLSLPIRARNDRGSPPSKDLNSARSAGDVTSGTL